MEGLLLSICIPTYGREELLKNTIESIYSNNIDNSLFEICISDNSPTDETKNMLEKYFFNYSNLHYSKTNCEGFRNSIESLKMGKGKFLKLQNNYTAFNADYFAIFIETLKKIKNGTLIFFSAGELKLYNQIQFEDFDSFMNCIHYYSSWSTSFCISKFDFDHLIYTNVELNNMFPHTSLLFFMTQKERYIVDDNLYFYNQNVKSKGGYNIPQVFGNDFLSMVEKLYLENNISNKTFLKIKKNLLYKYLVGWYVNVVCMKDVFHFSYEGKSKIITENFGFYRYLVFLFLSFIKIVSFKSKGFIKKLLCCRSEK